MEKVFWVPPWVYRGVCGEGLGGVSLWVSKRIVVLPWVPVLVRDPLGLVLARGAAGRLVLGWLCAGRPLSLPFLLGGSLCSVLFSVLLCSCLPLASALVRLCTGPLASSLCGAL